MLSYLVYNKSLQLKRVSLHSLVNITPMYATIQKYYMIYCFKNIVKNFKK